MVSWNTTPDDYSKVTPEVASDGSRQTFDAKSSVFEVYARREVTPEQLADRLEAITFKTDSADVSADGRATLEEIHELLAEYPQLKMTMEATASEVGDKDYNLELSKRRLANVQEIAVELGIDLDRVTFTNAKGEDGAQPGDREEDRAVNFTLDYTNTPETLYEKGEQLVKNNKSIEFTKEFLQEAPGYTIQVGPSASTLSAISRSAAGGMPVIGEDGYAVVDIPMDVTRIKGDRELDVGAWTPEGRRGHTDLDRMQGITQGEPDIDYATERLVANAEPMQLSITDINTDLSDLGNVQFNLQGAGAAGTEYGARLTEQGTIELVTSKGAEEAVIVEITYYDTQRRPIALNQERMNEIDIDLTVAGEIKTLTVSEPNAERQNGRMGALDLEGIDELDLNFLKTMEHVDLGGSRVASTGSDGVVKTRNDIEMS